MTDAGGGGGPRDDDDVKPLDQRGGRVLDRLTQYYGAQVSGTAAISMPSIL